MNLTGRLKLILISILWLYAIVAIIADVAHDHPQAPFTVSSNCSACVQSLTLCCVSTTGIGPGQPPEFERIFTLRSALIFLRPAITHAIPRAPPLVWVQDFYDSEFRTKEVTKGDLNDETDSKFPFFSIDYVTNYYDFYSG